MNRKSIAAWLLSGALALTALSACASQKAPDAASPGGAPAPSSKEAEAPAQAEAIEMQIGLIYTPDHIFTKACEKFASKVNEQSGGRLHVSVMPSSQLGGEADLADGVSMGSVTMTIAGPGEFGKRYPKALVFDSPYLLRDNDHLQAVANGEYGRQMWDEMAGQTGIRVLSALYLGSRYVTTSKVAVHTPADLAGVKLRVPDQPLSIAIAKAMGATPTPMAFSEVYLGLSQGTVDGQENPLSQIVSAKFYEVQKYLSKTGHVTQVVLLTINDDFYQSLPDDLKTLVSQVALECGIEASDEVVRFEKDTISELEGKGMTIVEPDRKAFEDATAGVVAQFEDQWGKGVYEEIKAIQ